MTGVNFNVTDWDKFRQGVQLIRESLFDGGATMFCADNLITWNRNLSFLREQFYVDGLNSDQADAVEKSIVWRRYILLYFAGLASHVEGDFLELGCHTGFTAMELLRRIDLAALGKHYYLYDLFRWQDGDSHVRLKGHKNPNMYEDTVAQFAPWPNVHVIRGSVPESFAQGFPDKIAFAHIDMNNPAPEAGALHHVLPRLSSRGCIVFDDYGWWGYSRQKVALDPIIAAHGLGVVELPTGQALLIKP
jgi:hypothetical protein